MRSLYFSAVFSVLGLLCPVLSADTLLNYDFTANSFAPTSVASAGFTATNFERVGLGAQTAEDWLYAPGNSTPVSLALGSYFGFTLTPGAGVCYDLTTLTYGVAYYCTTAGGAGTTNFVLRSDRDGFTADLESFSILGGQGNTSTPTFTTRTATLTSVGGGFTDLTSAITFRIYIFDSVGAGTRISAVDDVTVNGAFSTVPEPSTYALLSGVAALAFVAGRRRVKQT